MLSLIEDCLDNVDDGPVETLPDGDHQTVSPAITQDIVPPLSPARGPGSLAAVDAPAPAGAGGNSSLAPTGGSCNMKRN